MIAGRWNARHWSFPPLPFLASIATLGVTLLVFSSNHAYHDLMLSFERFLGGAGTSVPSEVFLISLFLLLFALGLWKIWALKAALWASWAMYGFSLAYYGDLDWLMAGSWERSFQQFSNDLGFWPVLLNGLMLVGTGLYLRSWQQTMARRDNFIERGADRNEVDLAIDGNMRKITICIAISVACAAFVSAMAWIVEPSIRRYVSDLVQGGVGLVAMVVSISLLLIVTFEIWGRGRRAV